MIAAMQPSEVLAIVRIRQWAADRAALRSARTVEYQRTGWQARNTRTFDARIVRVIDFERALATLTLEEQTVLLLTYRDGERQAATAHVANCSIRKLAYTLPAARKHLAEVLDRLYLL